MLPVNKITTCFTMKEALEALAADDNSMILAAGTDLVPMLRDEKLTDASLVDIKPIKDLDYIIYADGMLRIGSMTTHQNIAVNELVKQYLPALAESCKQVGSIQIRHRATIGGNICHASPAADTLPVLIAANACVVYRTDKLRKTILLESIYQGPGKHTIPQNAILEEVCIILPEGGYQGNFYKVGGRSALTISIASVAVLKGDDGYHVAYGSMGPTVKRVPLIEKYLGSLEVIDREKLRSVVGTCLFPISDIRASKEYRIEVASNLTWLGWKELQNS